MSDRLYIERDEREAPQQAEGNECDLTKRRV